MIENRDYVGKVFTSDHQGRIRTWPFLAEELAEWNPEVPVNRLPRLVEPGVRHDPMYVGESDG